MFTNAIERVAMYTRPVHTILRVYGGKQLIPGAATLFFINEKGYAITCKHVVEMLAAADTINHRFIEFKTERQNIKQDGKYKAQLKGLEMKYKFAADTPVQLKTNFVDCVDTLSGFSFIAHPTFDLALIKFNGFNKLQPPEFAKFLKDTSSIKQGKFLCRLGFPFPEFTNYNYDAAADDIVWTKTGNNASPRFPIEGMVTRFLAEPSGMFGIEMSTPGLRGQSGGPLFDEKGLVCGMQFSTKHLHLGFDMVDKEIMINNSVKKISDYSFIHLGQCIHADTIKAFLRQNNVDFYEEDKLA